MEIGNKILKFRKQQNITQEGLAEMLGVARQTISKWELGETSPDIEQSKKLSRIFNVSLDELVNNNINSVLIMKVSKIEKMTKIIINILKIILLIIVILVIVLVFSIYFKEYFSVEAVSQSRSIECEIDGRNYSYMVVMNNKTSYILDELITNDKEINIDVLEYINFEDIFKDIEKNVVSRGGECR